MTKFLIDYILLNINKYPNTITFLLTFIYLYVKIKYNVALLDDGASIYELEGSSARHELEGDSRFPRHYTPYNPNYVDTREGYRVELGDNIDNYPAELDGDDRIYPVHYPQERIGHPSHYYTPRPLSKPIHGIKQKQDPKVIFENHHNRTLWSNIKDGFKKGYQKLEKLDNKIIEKGRKHEAERRAYWKEYERNQYEAQKRLYWEMHNRQKYGIKGVCRHMSRSEIESILGKKLKRKYKNVSFWN